MKQEPPRLSKSSDSALVRQLLRSAVADAAPGNSRQRALVAASLAASAVAVSGGSAASALSGTAASLALKWLGTGFLVGCVGLGTIEVSQRALAGTAQASAAAPSAARPRPASAPRRSRTEAAPRLENVASAPEPAASVTTVTLAPSSPRHQRAPEAARATRAPEDTVPSRAPTGDVPSLAFPVARAVASSAPERPRPSTFAQELDLVDRARKAAGAGRSAEALALLDRLEREHAGGSFAPEATAIRVEVLLRAGRRSAAEALAQRFTAQHPNHPLARRVRALVGAASNR